MQRRRLHRRRRRREQPELLSGRHRSTARTSSTSPPTCRDDGTGKTILPAYAIKNVKGAKIGFIGMTLEDTPTIVTAAGVAGPASSRDEVDTANALVPDAARRRASTPIVVLCTRVAPRPQPWTDRRQPARSARLRLRVRRAAAPDPTRRHHIAELDPAIDMIVSGHTHQPYVCDIPDPAGKPRLVTSASSFGRLYTDTDAHVRPSHPGHRPPVGATRPTMIVTRDVAKDAGADRRSSPSTRRSSQPIANEVIGQIDGTTSRRDRPTTAGESPLGDLIADAQLADAVGRRPGGADAGRSRS